VWATTHETKEQAERSAPNEAPEGGCTASGNALCGVYRQTRRGCHKLNDRVATERL